jgi:hypothetical protein
MREMMNFCFVKRCGFNRPFQAHDIFYAVDLVDRITYAGEKPTAFIRCELLCMGDDVVDNLLWNNEVSHGRFAPVIRFASDVSRGCQMVQLTV